jgi:hypothetical protein
MLAKLSILLAVAFIAVFAHADNAITFSSKLPKNWVQLSSQTVPGTNTVTHDTYAADITVLQETTTNLTTMLISAAPAAAAQTTTNLSLEAANLIHSVLTRFGENVNFKISRLDLKTENKKTFAEAAFTVELQDTTLFGVARYEIVDKNAVGWVAFGANAGIETNKTVLGIAKSIKIRK